MKFSAAIASVALLSAGVSLPDGAFAFTPPSSRRRVKQPTSRLGLVDPAAVASAVGSSSVITSDSAEVLGQLTLLGSVAAGVAFGNVKNRGSFNYEYKVGNELLEEEIESVPETEGEEGGESADEPEPELTSSQASFFGKMFKGKSAASPAPALSTPEVKPPSKEVLESTEVAKAEVQKVGMKEMKEKMDAKADQRPPSPEPTPTPLVKSEDSSTEVAAPDKKPGAKRRFAKGMALLLTAGAVAAARNVVKAYLGRGML